MTPSISSSSSPSASSCWASCAGELSLLALTWVSSSTRSASRGPGLSSRIIDVSWEASMIALGCWTRGPLPPRVARAMTGSGLRVPSRTTLTCLPESESWTMGSSTSCDRRVLRRVPCTSGVFPRARDLLPVRVRRLRPEAWSGIFSFTMSEGFSTSSIDGCARRRDAGLGESSSDGVSSISSSLSSYLICFLVARRTLLPVAGLISGSSDSERSEKESSDSISSSSSMSEPPYARRWRLEDFFLAPGVCRVRRRWGAARFSESS